MRNTLSTAAVLYSLLIPGAAAAIYTSDFGANDGGFVVANNGRTAAEGFVYSPSGWAAAGGEGVGYSNLTSPTITVPTAGTVTLNFTHRYFLEADWDGGAVYVSVNGGASTYVPAGAFAQNGYVSPLTSGTYPDGIFTGGEWVFTGQSSNWSTPSYIESIASLGTLNAGDTVAITFRGGWDWAFFEAPPDWEIKSVTLDVVPEPTAAAASLLGIGLVCLRRRRTR